MGVVGLFGIAYAVGSDTAPPNRSDEIVDQRIENPPAEERDPIVLAENGPDAGAPRPRRPDAGRPRTELTVRDPIGPGPPREICVAPTPSNVSIAVDGAAPCDFGPSCRCFELTTGQRHSFRLVGAENCCVPQTFTPLITADTPSPVRLQLRYQPARVYVLPRNTGIGRINVQVEGGASGAARDFILVDLGGERRASRRVTVSAAGHIDYSRTHELSVGRDTTIEVTLEPIAAGPTAENRPSMDAPAP
jgi:hypothetical protein